jgi:Amt family ammonium transporter
MRDQVDVLWILITAALVFVMQPGFCCLEYGSVRKKNSVNVAIKNFTDFLIALLAFWAVGFGFMFGPSRHGLVGLGEGFFAGPTGSARHDALWLFQAMFCGTAATIVSGAIAERVRFGTYLVTTTVTSALIYPVFGHWVWGGAVTGEKAGWLEALGFIDFAGSSVVHVVGGAVGLAGALVLGPRLGKYGADGRVNDIAAQDIPIATLGAFLLWVGWFGFNGGSRLALDASVPPLIVNTYLAGAAGGLAAMLLRLTRRRTWDVLCLLNGSLGGLVGITAGCAFVTPVAAVVIGAVAGLVVCYGGEFLERRLRVDDPVGAVPVHALTGLWGTLAVGLFALPEHVAGWAGTRGLQVLVQGLGTTVAFVWAFGTGYLAFKALALTTGVRVSAAEEQAGLNLAEHGLRSPFHDMLDSMKKITADGDLSRRLNVEPESDEGEAALIFNAMMDEMSVRATELRLANHALQREILERERIEQALRSARSQSEQLLTAMSAVLIGLDHRDCVTQWNGEAERLLGLKAADVLGRPLRACAIPWSWTDIDGALATCRGTNATTRLEELHYCKPPAQDAYLSLAFTPFRVTAHEAAGVVIVGSDVTTRKQLEIDLAHAQKLEAVGQLAAGIAHEINTPTQYVGDNLRFVKDAFGALSQLIGSHRALLEAAKAAGVLPDLADDVERVATVTDAAYLLDETPKAIEQSLDGVARVARIVAAMKEFSHPGSAERKLADINRAIETTITVARNAWKYVADVVTDLDPALPPVPCLPAELNQVILNLLVNAAHAIADVVGKDSGKKGRITVSTRHDGTCVEIRLTDTGSGIPEAIRQRVFDPFFTTKEVGKGTGQGLAIARSVVVDKHGGTITFETETGKGTTFIVRLPLHASDGDAHPEAVA